MTRSANLGKRPTTGIIVAGGSSSRFGSDDKALVEIDGRSMIGRVVDRLVPLVDRIVVNTQRSQHSSFARALSDVTRPIQFAIDRETDRGPVAGLERALEVVTAERVFVLGCDLPLLRTATLSSLRERHDAGPLDGSDCTLPVLDSRPQPLCGVYTTNGLERAIDGLETVQNSPVYAVLDRLCVSAIPGEELPGGPAAFENVNTRNDLRQARAVARGPESGSLLRNS